MMRRDVSIAPISLQEATKKCLDNNFSSPREKNNCVEIFMKNGSKENKIAFIVTMESNERTIPFFENLSNDNKILIFKQTQVELDELSNKNIYLCKNEELQIKVRKQLESQVEQQNEEILKLRLELKERDEKISSQEQELNNQGEKISSQELELTNQAKKILKQELELKERDEKISSQKQELGIIKSSILGGPTPTEPKYTLNGDIVAQKRLTDEESRPSPTPLFANTQNIENSNLNPKKTNCLSISDRCVTM